MEFIHKLNNITTTFLEPEEIDPVKQAQIRYEIYQMIREVEFYERVNQMSLTTKPT